MLLQERQTTHAIAFNVDLKPSSIHSTPQIKKRLEEEAQKAAHGANITLEQISEKLKRAEEKRRNTIASQIDNKSLKEKRRFARIDERRSQERVEADQLKEKVYTHLKKAGEKRITEREQRMQKLRRHISKVEEICKEQAVRRQTSQENLRNEINNRLDSASAKREQQLEKKKTVAMKSAEKKMQVVHDNNGAQPAPQWVTMIHSTFFQWSFEFEWEGLIPSIGTDSHLTPHLTMYK